MRLKRSQPLGFSHMLFLKHNARFPVPWYNAQKGQKVEIVPSDSGMAVERLCGRHSFIYATITNWFIKLKRWNTIYWCAGLHLWRTPRPVDPHRYIMAKNRSVNSWIHSTLYCWFGFCRMCWCITMVKRKQIFLWRIPCAASGLHCLIGVSDGRCAFASEGCRCECSLILLKELNAVCGDVEKIVPVLMFFCINIFIAGWRRCLIR